MRLSKISLMPLIMAVLVVTLYSCKAKKIAQVPENPEPIASSKAPAPEPEAAAVEEKKVEEAPAEAKPDYNFSNIQFEFNSSVLKTFSYTVLDQIAKEIKKDPSAQFNINGHSSAEGTPERNMTLSKDRAISVKSYLVSSGINSNNLITNGFGESKPIVSNNTEANKVQNRRVEVIKE